MNKSASLKCGLCLHSVSGFAKSHVIPKALMIDGLACDEYLAIAGSKGERPATISHTGIWSRIVCPSCEASFNADDDYLIKVVKALPSYPTAFDGAVTALEGVSAIRLYRSIISVLFRANLSNHFMFKRVVLGAYSEPVRKFILDPSNGWPVGISVFLRHISKSLGGIVLNPQPEKWEGVNAYRFYFPHLTAMIKVDQRPFPSHFSEVQLGSSTTPYALRFDSLSPSEIRSARVVSDTNSVHLERMFGRFKARRGGEVE